MGNWILIVPKYHRIDYLLTTKGKKVTLSMEKPGWHNLKQSKLISLLKIQPDSKLFLL